MENVIISADSFFAIWALVNLLYTFSIIFRNKIPIIEKIYKYHRTATYLILATLSFLVAGNFINTGLSYYKIVLIGVLINMVVVMTEEMMYKEYMSNKTPIIKTAD